MALGAWNEADRLLSVPWPCEHDKDRIQRVVMGGWLGEVGVWERIELLVTSVRS